MSQKHAATYHPDEGDTNDHGRTWIPCPCTELETRHIPESGCPSCDDHLGHWVEITDREDT